MSGKKFGMVRGNRNGIVVNNRLKKKFNLLVPPHNYQTDSHSNEQWLVNLTDIDIPPEVQRTLSLGSKFARKRSRMPYEKLITDTKYIVLLRTKAPEAVKTEVGQSITTLLTKMKKSTFKKKPASSHISN